jgi:hypothetical protein
MSGTPVHVTVLGMTTQPVGDCPRCGTSRNEVLLGLSTDHTVFSPSGLLVCDRCLHERTGEVTS